jgi:hypothetical protein
LSKPDSQRLARMLNSWAEAEGCAEPLPAGMAAMLPAAMASIERSLTPATPEDIAGLMARLWKSGVPCPDKDSLLEWLRLLAPYPAKDIAAAFDELAKSYRWPSPPKVADAVRFIAPLVEKRGEWRRKLVKAQTRAALDAKATRPATGTAYADMTENDRAAFDAKMAALKASFNMQAMGG